MTETETSTEVAKSDEKDLGATALIEVYATEFAAALPTHIDAGQWVRQGIAMLRQKPDLLRAANNHPYQCMKVFFEAARLGHVPGTKEFYLVPRGNKDLGYERNPKTGKNRARQEITGIEGYQGLVERMHRAGAITSVKVELVREKDSFDYRPGVHERPIHEVDWWSDRGEVKGGYAYAEMVSGGVSRVVVMTIDEINKHRDASDSWKYESQREYSPWTTWPDAMRLKTLVRQLEPWVPTSNEYLREKIRLAAEVKIEQERQEREREEHERRQREQEPVIIEGEMAEGGSDGGPEAE